MTSLRPITVWEMWVGPRRDQHLEHNHIEDGHSERLYPLAKFPEQKAAWHGQTWVRTHAYLNEASQVITLA